MNIRKLDKEEHSRTRRLYETVFSEDAPCFVDYYYRYKAGDNEIYVAEEGPEETGVGKTAVLRGQSGKCTEPSDTLQISRGKIRAMLHLNPCRICWAGEEETIDYMVAVATQEEYRHQGLMRQLIRCSLSALYEQQAPFVFLMPASEAIYLPFGFRRAWDWQWEEEVLKEERQRTVRRPVDQCSEQQLLELSSRVNEALSRKFSMFSLRSPAYYRKLSKEQQASGGKLEILFRQEGEKESPVSACCGAKEQFPSKMIRIINLESFIRRIKSKKEKIFYWQVTDELLPGNRGAFKVVLTPAGGELIPLEENGNVRQMPERRTADISEIPELLGEDDPFADAMICEVV